jgi:hypothetical protein
MRIAAGDAWPATLGDTLDADSDLPPIEGPAKFDTCIGRIALGRAPDTVEYLAKLLPMLRFGGRAILVAHNRRFHRALMRALADIALRMRDLPSAVEDDRGRLLALLSQGRLRQSRPGLFTPEAMRRAAFDAGFATAEIRPLRPDLTGVQTTRRWLKEIGVSGGFSGMIGGLVAATGGRYLKLLGATDASETMLICLAKGDVPKGDVAARPERHIAPPIFSGAGGLPPHWAIDLLAHGTPAGVRVSVGGWCLLNADGVDLAITLNGIRRQTAVRHPRPDVDVAMNQSGLYSAWGALCCGLQDEILFEGVRPHDGAIQLKVEIVLKNGTILHPDAPPAMTLDRPVLLTA